jgi:hypothetical protein
MLSSDFLPENFDKSILGATTQESKNADLTYIKTIFQSISYTHFTELIIIDDSTIQFNKKQHLKIALD